MSAVLIAKDLMTRDLLTLHTQDSVGTALTAMISRAVTCAPVTDNRGHPLGILSLSDIVSRSAGCTAGARMTSPAIVIGENAALAVVARLQAATGLHRIVVVNREGRAVGLVTSLDLMRALENQPGPEVQRELESYTGLDWTSPHPLEMSSAERAPFQPGLFALLQGAPGSTELVIWAEAAEDIRNRLTGLLIHPEREQPLLAMLIDQRLLRFRTVPVKREAQRIRILSHLLEQIRADWAVPASARLEYGALVVGL